MTGLVALGDSFTCGEGVGVRIPQDQTWTALLAKSLGDPSRLSLAAPGARVRDVFRNQLPHVPETSVATLLVGLNDVARAGFDAARVQFDLLRIVGQLCSAADVVLVARLHDPVRLLWLPSPLRRQARERVAVVNAAVDEAAFFPRVHVLDLDAVRELRVRTGWAVDRIHPSLLGHAALADAAAEVLRRAGRSVLNQIDRPAAYRPTRVERLWWLSRHGVPYAARNLRARTREAPRRSG